MRKKSGPPFVMIEHATMKCKEWKALTPSEKLIYIKIKANYNGINNGEISFKYSEAKEEFSSATICRALKGLIEKGWCKTSSIFPFGDNYNSRHYPSIKSAHLL